MPAENLLGKEGQGFKMMMNKLQQERLSICVTAMGVLPARPRRHDRLRAAAEGLRAADRALPEHPVHARRARDPDPDRPDRFVDQLIVAHVRGDDIVSEVSMAKWWTTDLQKKVVAECLQLHGGYGFMHEYPISQDYADAAVQSIYAGSNEIMKVIIAKRMGLRG